MSRTNKIKAIGSVALIALIAVIYFIVFIPHQDNLAAVQDEVSYQNDINDKIYADNQQLRKFIELVPAAEEYNEALMRRFPATSEAQALRSAILAQAGTHNIRGISVTLEVPSLSTPPQDVQVPVAPDAGIATDPTVEAPTVATPNVTPSATSPLAYQTVSITGEGSAEDIANFLQALETMERALIITNMDVNSNENVSSFSLTSYSYLHAPVLLEELLGDESTNSDEPAQATPSATPDAEVAPGDTSGAIVTP